MKGTKMLWAIVIGLIIGAILTSGFTMAVFSDISTAESASAYSSKPCNIKFDFAAGTEGWIPATVYLNNTDNRAIYEVAPSADLNYTYTGAYSLKMSVDLQPGKDSPKRKGEALVMYTGNLKGHQITARVWCPTGSIGNPHAPNGIMLFAKDCKWKSEYGSWENIEENTWRELSLEVDGQRDLPYGNVSPDFDPTDVIVIGLKIGANDKPEAKGYKGPIYLDTVCFNITPWAVPESDYKFDEHMPYWDIDKGWNATAWRSEDITIKDVGGEHGNVLAINCSFSLNHENTTDENYPGRKGYVGIEALPNIDISNKDNKIIQAQIKFEPYVDPYTLVGCIYAYDRRAIKWFKSADKPVGGHGWNVLSLNLTNEPPESLKQLLKVGIQIYASKPYNGTIYIDNITIGGKEIMPPSPPSPPEHFVKMNETHFEIDGKPFYFAGDNCYYLFYTTHYMIDDLMSTLRNNNITVLRTWGFCDGLANYSDDSTPDVGDGNEGCTFQPRLGEYDELTFRNFDYVIKSAGKHGIRLIIPLVNYWSDKDKLDKPPSSEDERGVNSFGGIVQYLEWCGVNLTDDDYNNTEEYLFSIDTKFEDELNNGSISEELKEEFKKSGFSLPDNATVKKEEKKWEITDEKKFIIRKEEGKLNISGGEKYPWHLKDEVRDLFYTNESCKDAYKSYVGYMLNRTNTLTGIVYKEDPTIFAWELANEPRCPSDSSGNTIYNWTSEMSAYIKKTDQKHLVALGDEGFFRREPGNNNSYYNGSFGVNWTRILDISTIDFGTVHVYPDHWEKEINWTETWITDHINKSREIGKPVVFEEFGICFCPYINGKYCCTAKNCNNFDRDKVFKNWTKLFEEGAAGDCVWMIAGRSNGPQEDVIERCKPGYGSPSSYYPNYDGFTFWDHNQTRSTMAIIREHAEKMNNKSLSTFDTGPGT